MKVYKEKMEELEKLKEMKERDDLQDEEVEVEDDNRTDNEYANGYPRRGYTCADCIYSDCDGNQLCSLFEPW